MRMVWLILGLMLMLPIATWLQSATAAHMMVALAK
jgi:hypothetical protein